MLVQYTPVNSLSLEQRQRLAQAARVLLTMNEASTGRVMWEGKYFQVSEIQALVSSSRQFLQEG